jgi:hypothetical protein
VTLVVANVAAPIAKQANIFFVTAFIVIFLVVKGDLKANAMDKALGR